MTDGSHEINRQDAEKLLIQALQIGECINHMMEALGGSGSSETKIALKASIGSIAGHNADIIFKIRKIYPDLHPMFDEFN